jgi:phosphoglycolate phosphatase-like HAD superfamily hydrolase
MKRPFLVFDLDGTLIDGYDAIGDALAYAMGKFGLPALPPEQVRVMVGHGIEKLLEKAVGRDTAPEGVRLFREHYPHVAVSGSRLLPDVAAVLASLEQRGYRMAVASNKPAKFSRMILDACGVGAYFTAVGGPDEETPTKPDPAMLHRLMAAEARARRDDRRRRHGVDSIRPLGRLPRRPRAAGSRTGEEPAGLWTRTRANSPPSFPPARSPVLDRFPA